MTTVSNSTHNAVLLGAGGHAKVVLSLARAVGWTVLGVCDPELARLGHKEWRDLHVLGGDEALAGLNPEQVVLLNGVGQTSALPGARRRLFEELRQHRFQFPILAHPHAAVDPSAVLEEGAQIMAGAVVQADCHVGANTIVNTHASVDHDGVVGAHVHVAPGAVLCGNVRVDDNAFIGAGATVVQGVHVGSEAFVAAGSLLTRDLDAGRRWPAREEPRAHQG